MVFVATDNIHDALGSRVKRRLHWPRGLFALTACVVCLVCFLMCLPLTNEVGFIVFIPILST